MNRHKLYKTALTAALLLAATGNAATAQESQNYVPTAENLKAREEFQDNKFGIFLHWGLYSMLAQGEWYMTNRDIDWREYEKLASGFYPSRFDAAEWVSAIKASGAKYICFTSRHHEGFSMFDTKYSDFNIVDATPFGRDVIKELADECHKQGIKIHFYYSHLDWRRDDYPQGRTGQGTGRPEGHGDWPHYYEFMNNQLTELLTNYGPVGAIWFDGFWDQPADFDWQSYDQYALKAFTVNSVDYLLKPISRQELTRAIDKYTRLYASGEEMQTVTPKMMENLIESLRGGGGYKRSLLISYKDKIIPVLVDDIAIIYIECTMVKLSTFSGHIYYLNQTLDDVMSQLDPRRFFRVSRQFILSADCIRDIEPYFNGKMVVHVTPPFDGSVQVSRERVAALKVWLNS